MEKDFKETIEQIKNNVLAAADLIQQAKALYASIEDQDHDNYRAEIIAMLNELDNNDMGWSSSSFYC